MNEKNPTINETVQKLFTRTGLYYIRNGNKPIGTVVLGVRKGSGQICRGISICSSKDNFDREEGRVRAMRRMVNAALRRDDAEPIHTSTQRRVLGLKAGSQSKSVDKFLDRLVKTDPNACFGFKSEYNVAPTEREKHILAD